jgi:photosystem II stability/assembly factor-like uncharacterized protein
MIIASLALQGQMFKYTNITPPNWHGVSFNDLTFQDSLNGFAISSTGLLFRTKNAGDNWAIQRDSIVSASIFFKNE